MAETWNEATPSGTEAPQLGDDRIREVKRAVRERLAQDHDFEITESPAFGQAGATIGMHKKVTLVEQASGPLLAIIRQRFIPRTMATETLKFFCVDPTMEWSINSRMKTVRRSIGI